MSPSSLLNASPDLMREHAPHGAEVAFTAETDRHWTIGFSVVLALTAALLYLALG